LQTIAIRGKDNNSADNCSSTLKFFNATTNLTAAIINTLEITSADSIQLTYTPSQFVEYRIDIGIGGTNYQQFGNRTTPVAGSKTEQVGGLFTDANFYCFQFRTVDPCLNTNVITGAICSVNLNLAIDNDVNHLTWTTNNASISDFTIARNADPAYKTISGVLNSTDDADITCATDYCYRLTANYSNGAKSISAPRCGISNTAVLPLPVDNIASIAEENSVELSWNPAGTYKAKEYFINRQENLAGFSTIATMPDSVFTDVGYNNLNTFTYRIDYQDVCNLLSPPGTRFSPILLNGNVNDDNTIQLTWNNYDGYRFGVFRYVLEKFDAQGALIRQRNFYPPDSTWLDEFDDLASQGVSYRLTAYPLENSIPASKSNPLYLERRARLIFPTAFSPNGDNLNDGFTVYGQFVRSMKLQIFDRWGELLFSTEASEAWDGTHRGQKMPESVYIWKASITDLLGRSLTRTGSVALLNTKN
jgi:gliding motility-associated-like protein